MFKTRLLSGVVLMVLAIITMFYGGMLLFGVTLLLSLIGLFELYRATHLKDASVTWLSYVVCIVFYCFLLQEKLEVTLLIFIVAMMLFLAVYVITFPKYHINQIALLLFSILYIPFMFSYVYKLRMMDGGIYTIWLVFVGSWGSDTCAYCVGKLFGKHKLPSKLSPNKTIEGCVGGMAGAALIGAIYAAVFSKELSMFWQPVLSFAVIGAVCSIFSQIGDLAASGIKRNYEIKDYGTLIPGHGGVLDRFDSVIFIAPVVYYLILYIAMAL